MIGFLVAAVIVTAQPTGLEPPSTIKRTPMIGQITYEVGSRVVTLNNCLVIKENYHFVWFKDEKGVTRKIDKDKLVSIFSNEYLKQISE